MHGQVRLLLDDFGVAFPQFDQVLAGTEGLGPGARDDRDAQRGFLVEPLEDAVQVPVHGVGDAVHLAGAVDGHQQNEWCWV